MSTTPQTLRKQVKSKNKYKCFLDYLHHSNYLPIKYQIKR